MLFIFIQKVRAQKYSSKCPTSFFKNPISIRSLQLIDASSTQLICKVMVPLFRKYVPLICLFSHIYYGRMYRHNDPQGMSSLSLWLWSIWWTLLRSIHMWRSGTHCFKFFRSTHLLSCYSSYYNANGILVQIPALSLISLCDSISPEVICKIQ